MQSSIVPVHIDLLRARREDEAIWQRMVVNFISYNKADQGWAEWIAWQLEAEGYSTIIQAWDFRPGGNFVLQMNEATKNAKRTIAVLSPSYIASLFTQSEWAAAFAQDPTFVPSSIFYERDCHTSIIQKHHPPLCTLLCRKLLHKRID